MALKRRGTIGNGVARNRSISSPGDKKQQDMGLDVGARNGLLSVRTVHTYLYS